MRLGVGVLLVSLQVFVANAARPNFIVVLADDLGFGDLGCYGNKKVQSPRIVQFTAEGVRLTSC